MLQFLDNNRIYQLLHQRVIVEHAYSRYMEMTLLGRLRPAASAVGYFERHIAKIGAAVANEEHVKRLQGGAPWWWRRCGQTRSV
jgi:hypothetical protein